MEALIRAANQEGISLQRDPSCSGGILTSIESASNILSTDHVGGVADRDRRTSSLAKLWIIPLPLLRSGVALGDKFPERFGDVLPRREYCRVLDRSVGAVAQVARLAAAMEKLSVSPIDSGLVPAFVHSP